MLERHTCGGYEQKFARGGHIVHETQSFATTVPVTIQCDYLLNFTLVGVVSSDVSRSRRTTSFTPCCSIVSQPYVFFQGCSGAKTIKKNPNSTKNKSQTHRAKQYEVTSFLSTDCELSTETCSKNVYSLGPLSTS